MLRTGVIVIAMALEFNGVDGGGDGEGAVIFLRSFSSRARWLFKFRSFTLVLIASMYFQAKCKT